MGITIFFFLDVIKNFISDPIQYTWHESVVIKKIQEACRIYTQQFSTKNVLTLVALERCREAI